MTEPERDPMYSGSFSALWREVGAQASTTRKGLDLHTIVEAAVRIADERGLSDVSMARVAKRLGYSTMALYRHVSNKDELLALMFDVGVGTPPVEILAIPSWRERVHAYADAFAAIYRRRPWLVDLPITGPPIGPNNVGFLNLMLTALEETRLDIRDRAEVFIVLTNYLLGMQRLEIEINRTGKAAKRAGFAVDEASYGRVLSRLSPPGMFPAIDSAIAEGVFDDDREDDEDETWRGIERILDGIEVLMVRRGVIDASSASWMRPANRENEE